MKLKNLKKSKTTNITRKKLIINRKNRSNAFVIQIIIGVINFILFLTLIVMVLIFRNDLYDYRFIITFSLYAFFLFVSDIFSLIFYFYLKPILINKEKKYFLNCLILSLFGFNLFVSIWFYFNSGLSKKQIQKIILIIKKERINEIINQKNIYEKLQTKDLLKLKILFKIIANKHETIDNVHSYILKWLSSKGISTDIKITDEEVLKLAKDL